MQTVHVFKMSVSKRCDRMLFYRGRTLRYRYKFTRLLKIIGMILLIPILLMTVCSSIGEGLTFEAARAYIGTKKTMDSMMAGEYQAVVTHMGVGRGESPEAAADERRKVADELQSFFDQGYEMDGYRIVSSTTDDGFTIVTTYLTLEGQDMCHSFTVRLSIQDGKVCPMDVIAIDQGRETKRVATRFIDIIRTYDPG